MRVRLNRQSLLHDIANLAFVIADIHSEADEHARHQLTDICQEGNIDRVSRMMGLAYCIARETLKPLRDIKRNTAIRGNCITLNQLVHEFIVCSVLADWLSITIPAAAGVWKEKAQLCMRDISATVRRMTCEHNILTRKMHPF